MTSRLGVSWERAKNEEHVGGLPVKALIGASKFVRDLTTGLLASGEEAYLRPRQHMLDGTVTATRNTLRSLTQGRPLAAIGNALNIADEMINDGTDALTGKKTFVIDTARGNFSQRMNAIQP